MNFAQENASLPIKFGPKSVSRISFRSSICADHFVDLNFPVELSAGDPEVWIFSSIPCNPGDHKVLWMERGKIYYSPSKFPRYLTDFDVDFETYLSSFGSKSKSTLKRKIRKFTESAGPNYFREFKSPEELLDFHAQARQLSARTYQETLLDHGLPDTPEFEKRMVALAEEDQVRAYILYFNGNAVAYLYCPASDGILRYDLLGYDPDFRAHSPGTVLQYLAFEQLFAEKRFRAFDFEEGEGQHKRQFATRSVECCNLFVFRPSLKSIAYISLAYLFTRMTSATLFVLDKTGLRRRVRQLIR
jgi:CelD/BcsL family acetyltransferase involved in cellulose biosynthesis